MAKTSISVPDDLLDDFDKVLTVMEARDELDTDDRSPLIQQWIREFVDDHQEELEVYNTAFEQGNPNRAAPVTAD